MISSFRAKPKGPSCKKEELTQGECHERDETTMQETYVKRVSKEEGFDGHSGVVIACWAKCWTGTGDSEFPEGADRLEYLLTENKETLWLNDVERTYCKPVREECKCKEMVARALQQNPEVKEIQGMFGAEPMIVGCRCYLGAAARAGFTSVRLDSKKKGCTEPEPISPTEGKHFYADLCKKWKKLKCASKVAGAIIRVRGYITKS